MTPCLYFRKTNKETGIFFDEPFTGKNCPEWYQTPFCELETKAKARIDYWNSVLSGWHYEILDWRVEE
jgi:hypothetical protein